MVGYVEGVNKDPSEGANAHIEGNKSLVAAKAEER